MKAPVLAVVLSLAAASCAWSKPAASPENADDSESSNDSDKPAQSASGGAADPAPTPPADTAEHTPPPSAKATIKDDTEAKITPCSGDAIPDLLAAISEAACEVPDKAPVAKLRPTKDLLEVRASTDGRIAPGSTARIRIVYKNKGKAPLSLDFTIDPDPQFRFELYNPKGTRMDRPPGSEPALPPEVADAPVPDSHTARVTLAPSGTATLVLPWDAVRYRWASKQKAKGALPGRGYPREPAGPLARGKYVLKVLTPLTNTDEGADHELSEARLNIEVAGTAAPASPPPSAEPPAPVAKKAAPPPAATPAPAPEPTSDDALEKKFLQVTGGPSSPPASKKKK